MLNRITLVGRLTRTPEIKYTTTGKAVANFSIASDKITKDAEGQKETNFFDIVAWGKTAEFVSQYLDKGRLVSVDGRLDTRHWMAQDGTKRKQYEIVADNVNGLDRKPENANSASQNGTQEPGGATDNDSDESDPFADE